MKKLIYFFSILSLPTFSQRADLLPIITTMPNSDRVMVYSGSVKTITKGNFLNGAINTDMSLLTTYPAQGEFDFSNSYFPFQYNGVTQKVSLGDYWADFMSEGISFYVDITTPATGDYFLFERAGSIRKASYSSLFSGGGAVSLTNNILAFDGSISAYRPYNSLTEAGVNSVGAIYSGTSTPTSTTRRNINANLHATSFNAYAGISSFPTANGVDAIYARANANAVGVRIYSQSISSVPLSIDASYGAKGIYILKDDLYAPAFTDSLPSIEIERILGSQNCISDFIRIKDNPQSSVKGGSFVSYEIGNLEPLRLQPRINDTINEVAYKFGTSDVLTALGSKVLTVINGSDTIFDVLSNGIVKAHDSLDAGESIKVGNSWFDETALTGGGFTVGNGIDITGNVISLNDTSLFTFGANLNLATQSATQFQNIISNGSSSNTFSSTATKGFQKVGTSSSVYSVRNNLTSSISDTCLQSLTNYTCLNLLSTGFVLKNNPSSGRYQSLYTNADVTLAGINYNVTNQFYTDFELGQTIAKIGSGTSAGTVNAYLNADTSKVYVTKNGNTEFTVENNKVTVTDTLQTKFVKGTTYGDWDDMSYVIKPPRTWMAFTDSTLTIPLTVGEWVHISNPSDSLFGVKYFNLMTINSDTVIAAIAGYYEIDLTLSFTGATFETYEVRIISEDGELHKLISGSDSTTPNEITLQADWTASSGEKAWAEIRNVSSSDDATIYCGGLRIKYIHR